MRRRRSVLAVLMLLLAVAAVLGGVGYLLKSEPADYLAAVPALADDNEVAARTITKYSDFRTNLRQQPEWVSTFTAAEINAFIRDQLTDRTELYGTGVSGPRVVGRGDKMLLAARVGDGWLSTVANLEVRAWLVGPEQNTVAVELGSLRAGALPIGSHWLMDRISDEVRQYNMDVTWYRHEGRPVGLFKLFADAPRPPTRLRSVTLADGSVTISGRATGEAGVVTP